MSRRRPAAAAMLAVVAVALAACGGGTPASTTTATGAAAGRPVSDAQALVLAQLLERDWEHGGAELFGEIPVHGVQVRLRGRVDFRAGRGTVLLTPPSRVSQPRRYAWTRTRVFAQSAPRSQRYEIQAPDPKGDPVHYAIAFVNLLSAETIDNTANIESQDARFVRRDALAGVAVDVYRYGRDGATTYWVGHADGLLHQVQANLGPRGRIRLTLTHHGPQRIALPATSEGGAGHADA